MIQFTLLVAIICAAIVLKYLYTTYTIFMRRKQEAIDRMDTLYDVDVDKPSVSLRMNNLFGKNTH